MTDLHRLHNSLDCALNTAKAYKQEAKRYKIKLQYILDVIETCDEDDISVIEDLKETLKFWVL